MGENASSGYHGYWITDFLDVDPHLGTREDFQAFVDAAQARGMKVYMDIITNHTADVISYAECPASKCAYATKGDAPWTTMGGPNGAPINAGFLGDDPEHLTRENFAKLTDVSHSYTPRVSNPDEVAVKNPAWLNDPRYYTNRGDTDFDGEDSLYGDFAGLDDLLTQHPDVVDGFIDIYKQWITDFGVDGFRIDTVKHVNVEFWREWTPAIAAHAKAQGIDHFHMFGEVYEFDVAHLATWVVDAGLPSVLDVAFQGAVEAGGAKGEPARVIARVTGADAVYGAQESGRPASLILPTFLGNHDMGRIAGKIKEGHPDADEAELLQRSRLAHAIMMFSRGVPTIYYGDEQGFVGDGGDRGARETMFPAVAATYVDNDNVGSDVSPAVDNFDIAHPLYRAIADMAAVRSAHPTLRRGVQRERRSDSDAGFLAFSRIDADAGVEILVAVNADETARSMNVTVNGLSRTWSPLMGSCAASSPAAGSLTVEVPPLDVVVCRSVWGE